MSLYGALYSGVSGLTAQSSAMGAIADNISNVNTTGYKTTNVKFQTLVTKQTALTTYSPGGVQSRPRQNVDEQGLLASTTSATDLAVSGNGFFVVTANANPATGDLWSYTRAGSFKTDSYGYLQNSSGYYIQGWSLLPYDGSPNASTVKVGDFYYMKAYKDNQGNVTYINDNIVDSTNLKPINLSTIGGSATPTRNVRIGANLPSSDSVYDPTNPAAGGIYNSSTLIYDSLGNAHNVSVKYTKTSENAWDIDIDIPSGASSLVMYSQRENTIDTDDDVYAAYGQMEFNSIPANHSYIRISDGTGTNQKVYVFEFSADGSNSYVPAPGETLVTVDISTGVNSVSEAVRRLNTAIHANVPEGGRFQADNNRVVMTQSLSGNQVTINASSCLACQQASANPDLITGVPTGIYTIPSIDDELKNTANIDFTSTVAADYVGNSIILGNNVYEFTNGTATTTVPGAIAVDLAGAITGTVVNRETLVQSLMTQIHLHAQEPNRFSGSGTSIVINPSETGDDILINTTGVNELLTFASDASIDYEGRQITIGAQTYTLTSTPGGPNDVDISNTSITSWGTPAAGSDVMALLITAVKATQPDIVNQLQVKGNTIVAEESLINNIDVANTTGGTANGLDTAVEGRVKNQGGSFVPLTGTSLVLTNSFIFNGTLGAEQGSNAVGVRFNSDGTPKYFNVSDVEINWANGAQNMNDNPDEGKKIELFIGNVNTADGLTQLSGEFTTSYTKQDGAKFGSYAGVSVSDTGLVIALFDNGDTRPIAQIPLATFVNPNGMSSLTGNVWIETDYSGEYTLRAAGSGGAGYIYASSLENSITDLGTEFTNMIVTQRAYSASAKVITTSDEMLDTLINIKR